MPATCSPAVSLLALVAYVRDRTLFAADRSEESLRSIGYYARVSALTGPPRESFDRGCTWHTPGMPGSERGQFPALKGFDLVMWVLGNAVRCGAAE